jgi:hypothetical protein
MSTVSLETPPGQLPACLCGCGQPVKNPGARFLQGHHMRVTARDAAGHALPIPDLHPPQPCECGCGEVVRKQGASFRPGHSSRTAEHKVKFARKRGIAVTRTCPACGKPRRVHPYRASSWVACSRVCTRAQRWRARAWNPLQHRVVDHLIDRRMTAPAFAESLGVNHHWLASWFRNEGQTVPTETIRVLAEALGMTFEDALDAAGGVTAEERRREHGRAMAARNLPAAGSAEAAENARRGGRANRGRKRSPEAIANTVASRKRTGGHDRWKAAAAKWSASDRGRVVHALMGRLHHSPHPSWALIGQWASEVGQRHNLPPRAVLGLWETHLRRRNLWPRRGGRPGEIDYARVHEWRTATPPVKWEVIGARLRKQPDVLQAGYSRWKRARPSPATAEA